MQKNAVWKFKPLAKDDKVVDPIQHEFFTTESVGEIPEALIRESIQNSLDARPMNSRTPVRVRLFISELEHATRPQEHSPFFGGLEPHLAAKGNGLSQDRPDISKPLRFITIEDFGTKGLLGKPEEFDVDEGASGDHNYYYFWRNVGRSEKREDDRGRWGLGKTVFPASSRMNSFFGLTVTSSHKTGLLMGQAVLKNHKLEEGGKRYRPYGDFGFFESGEESEFFALPVTEPKTIEAFKNIFRLKRTSETGLSIVIPAPLEELKFGTLLTAVLRQYFYPILSGDLEVELERPGQLVTINRDTISSTIRDSVLEAADQEKLERLFVFTKWALERNPAEHLQLQSTDPRAPRWDPLLSELDPTPFQQRFDSEGRISFQITIRIHRNGGAPQNSTFDVFLERDPELLKGQGIFIRQGITITSVSPVLDANIRGIAVIAETPIGTFLGDSENPAHTEWQKNSPKFKGKYKNGPTTLDFVKRSLRELSLFLTRPRGGVDKDLLKDFFFIEEPLATPGESVSVGPDDDSESEATTDPTPPSGKSTGPLRIHRLSDGIRITHNPDATIELPMLASILFAYRVRRGNSFKRYHPLDFNLDSAPIATRSVGASIDEATENKLVFTANSKQFELVITGFDPSRDLMVQALLQSQAEDHD